MHIFSSTQENIEHYCSLIFGTGCMVEDNWQNVCHHLWDGCTVEDNWQNVRHHLGRLFRGSFAKPPQKFQRKMKNSSVKFQPSIAFKTLKMCEPGLYVLPNFSFPEWWNAGTLPITEHQPNERLHMGKEFDWLHICRLSSTVYPEAQYCTCAWPEHQIFFWAHYS